MLPSLVGWAATALFALSYFHREPTRLRLWQAVAAGVWMAYGVLIASLPVVVANAIVAGLALWSSWRARPLPIEDCEEGY